MPNKFSLHDTTPPTQKKKVIEQPKKSGGTLKTIENGCILSLNLDHHLAYELFIY